MEVIENFYRIFDFDCGGEISGFRRNSGSNPYLENEKGNCS